MFFDLIKDYLFPTNELGIHTYGGKGCTTATQLNLLLNLYPNACATHKLCHQGSFPPLQSKIVAFSCPEKNPSCKI